MAVFVSLILVFLQACGLESYPYLSPPGLLPHLGSDVFRFNSVTDNDTDVFVGYELYYKFYQTSSGTQLVSDNFEIANGTNRQDIRLKDAGYRRIRNGAGDPDGKPLIYLELAQKTADFEVRIDFSDQGSAKIEFDGIAKADIPILRGVKDGSGNYKDFSSADLDVDDDDLAALNINEGAFEVDIAIYALSFGRYELVKDVYSEPILLETVRLYDY